MPCFNEEDCIEGVVREFYTKIVEPRPDAEMIIVDDCSTDQTIEILGQAQARYPRLQIVRNQVRMGHGKSIRRGYELASKEYVFQADSDGQIDTADFLKLEVFKDQYDFVLGLRKRRQDSFLRKWVSQVITVFNFTMFGVWAPDSNCPCRILKRDVLQALLREIDKDAVAPNIMISVLAKLRHVSMCRVPMDSKKRISGEGTLLKGVLMKFCFVGLKQLLQFKKAVL